MWNQSKSLVLTAWWIRAALVLWLGIAVGLPFFLREPAILVLFYLIFVPVLAALYGLNKMLRNIQRGVVFAAMNVSCLRLVSWACFFAAVFLLVAACLWPMLVLAAGGIGFLGLFVRVIKNMLAEAISLKQENDLTI